MKKHLSTILLSVALVALIAVLVVLIVALMPRDCQHHVCAKTEHLPTCEEKGYTLYECVSCGYTFEADFIAPTGHSFTDTTVAPTCDGIGYDSHVCSVCGIEDIDNYIRPLGHTYTEDVTPPTCDTAGYTHHECERCGFAFVSDHVPSIGHEFTRSYVRPNIGRTGYTLYTCSVCGSKHKDDYVFYSDIFSGAEGEGEALAWGVDLYGGIEGKDNTSDSGDVDFAALKRAGVDFVILRVGSNLNKDKKFEEYYTSAKAAGLDVGVFFFSYAENAADAGADARRVANWLEGKRLEYPVFYDIEDVPRDNHYPSTYEPEVIADIVNTFMTEMVELGYYPGIYTNNSFLYGVYNDEKTLRMYDVWYARYGVDVEDYVNKNLDEFSRTYSMWQYAGSVEGFCSGAVPRMCDLNYAFKNYPEIIKKYGFNGYGG